MMTQAQNRFWTRRICEIFRVPVALVSHDHDLIWAVEHQEYCKLVERDR